MSAAIDEQAYSLKGLKTASPMAKTVLFSYSGGMFSLHDIRDFLLIVLAVAAAGSVSTGLFWLVAVRKWRSAKVVAPSESAAYDLMKPLPAEPSVTTYSGFPVISQFGFVGGGTHTVVKDGHGGSITFHN